MNSTASLNDETGTGDQAQIFQRLAEILRIEYLPRVCLQKALHLNAIFLVQSRRDLKERGGDGQCLHNATLGCLESQASLRVSRRRFRCDRSRGCGRGCRRRLSRKWLSRSFRFLAFRSQSALFLVGLDLGFHPSLGFDLILLLLLLLRGLLHPLFLFEFLLGILVFLVALSSDFLWRRRGDQSVTVNG